jgi:hypothetical protein
MDYVIKGLSAEPYRHLYGKTDEELKTFGVKRYIADKNPGYPDRIEMRDAEVGESLLLINHVSMEKETPYKASHAIFVREGAEHPYESRNEIPAVMFNRILSFRAFDANGMMVDAAVAQGEEIQNVVECFLDNDQVSYIDAHNAVRGCYSGKIERA